MIASIGKNRELGKDNKLLWNIKEDMQWFKTHTMNKPVVMGSATYESIGKPLKGRLNVVLSYNKEYNPHEDVMVCHSIDEVLFHLKDEREVMVIGGEKIYQQFLPYTNRIYLTEVDKEFEADTFFPEFDKTKFICYFSKEGTQHQNQNQNQNADAGVNESGLKYTFKVYKKKL